MLVSWKGLWHVTWHGNDPPKNEQQANALYGIHMVYMAPESMYHLFHLYYVPGLMGT